VSGYWFAVGLCVLFLIILVQLLRKKRIREKYVAVWLVAAIGIIVIGAFPKLSVVIANLVGVQLPVNLVFAVAIFFLLFVCVQLSMAVYSLEERTRALAEELALIKADRDTAGPAQPEAGRVESS
jgi:hypothetical protein